MRRLMLSLMAVLVLGTGIHTLGSRPNKGTDNAHVPRASHTHPPATGIGEVVKHL